MIQMTDTAIDKVRTILDTRNRGPRDCGSPSWVADAPAFSTRWRLRIRRACSTDLQCDGLKVFVDERASLSR